MVAVTPPEARRSRPWGRLPPSPLSSHLPEIHQVSDREYQGYRRKFCKGSRNVFQFLVHRVHARSYCSVLKASKRLQYLYFLNCTSLEYSRTEDRDPHPLSIVKIRTMKMGKTERSYYSQCRFDFSRCTRPGVRPAMTLGNCFQAYRLTKGRARINPFGTYEGQEVEFVS